MRRTLLHRRLFERGTAFLCLSCWCCFFFCWRFLSWVFLFLPFLSLCQVLDPKIITKTTVTTTARIKRKKKEKKSISSTLPSRPTILLRPRWAKKEQKSGYFTLESGGLGILTLASLCNKVEKQKFQSQIFPQRYKANCEKGICTKLRTELPCACLSRG